jgi:outer membrane murein-binding lipoprotein Lpp
MATQNAPENRIDPNVKVPAAVLAAAARSEELLKAQTEPQGEAPPEEASAETSPEVTNSDTNFSKSADEAPQVKDVKAPVSQESWEHRYNSMKGRFDQSQANVQRLSQEVSQLHRLMAEMQATHSAPAQADTKFDRLVTPEEESDYGSEFLGVVGKKAKEELTPEIKALRAKIAELEGRVQGVTSSVVQDAREKMYQTLDSQLPNWRELNSNPEFLSWLNLPDAYSGAIRKELLNAAYQRNDALRVAAFFKGFISDEAATNPAGSSLEREVTPRGNKPSLETLAAPGRAKTAAPAGGPAEKPFFTTAQITQFYSAVNRGEYRGREDEQKQIENQIFAAQREGRIRK